jgi:hypothetical protein
VQIAYSSMCAESQSVLLGNSMTGASLRLMMSSNNRIAGELVFSMQSDTRQTVTQQWNMSHHATPTTEELLEVVFCVGSVPRLYKGVQSCSWISRVVAMSWVGVSELIERWQVVSSAWELIAEGKYQLKPAVRSWCEMVASLWGCEPGSRGTSTIASRCQATLVKNVTSLV